MACTGKCKHCSEGDHDGWCLKVNVESRKFYEKVGGKEFRTGSHHWGGKEYEMISYLYDLA